MKFVLMHGMEHTKFMLEFLKQVFDENVSFAYGFLYLCRFLNIPPCHLLVFVATFEFSMTRKRCIFEEFSILLIGVDSVYC